MYKIKYFEATGIGNVGNVGFENQINALLKNITDGNLIDVKYSTCQSALSDINGGRISTLKTALVVYKE